MGFFKQKHSTCATCRVHFEPYESHEMLLNYCPTHRQPLLDAYYRKQAFLSWAESNMERLDEIRIKEQEAERAKYAAQINAALNAMMQGAAQAQQSAVANGYNQMRGPFG